MAPNRPKLLLDQLWLLTLGSSPRHWETARMNGKGHGEVVEASSFARLMNSQKLRRGKCLDLPQGGLRSRRGRGLEVGLVITTAQPYMAVYGVH